MLSRPRRITDSVQVVNEAHDGGKRILIEGANATMLDLDFGTYPYVTSSNPSIGGVISGLGLAPQKLQTIIGVVRICVPSSLHCGAHVAGTKCARAVCSPAMVISQSCC